MKPFEILVYAIIALAVLIIAFFAYQNFLAPKPAIDFVKNAVNSASGEPTLGHLVEMRALHYTQGTEIRSSNFASAVRLAKIECINPNICCEKGETPCKKSVEWDETRYKVTETKNIDTYARCSKDSALTLCTVYVGTTPAQAKIDKLSLSGNNSSGETEISVVLKNTGKVILPQGTNYVILYKKGSEGWVLTDYNAEPKLIAPIQPGETQTVFWALNPKNYGQYRAKFVFEGTESGFDSNTIEFEKTTNTTCQTAQETDTIADPQAGNYQEIRSCTGCNYAFECTNAWKTKEPGIDFYNVSAAQTYCIKTTADGAC